MGSPEGWTVIGGSVTGRTHAQRGIGCEDAHGWVVDPRRRRVCIAVADGAGSRAQAALASAIAAEVVVNALSEAPKVNDSSVRSAFRDAHQALVDRAASDDKSVAEFGTTLGVAVVSQHVLTVAQLGDTIAVAKRDGVSTTLSPAPKYEYANQTDLLSADDWDTHLRVDVVSAIGCEGFSLSTDGLRYKLLDDIATAVPFQPFFDDIFAFAGDHPGASKEVLTFLEELDDQTGDDLTLVVAVPTAHKKKERVVNSSRMERTE